MNEYDKYTILKTYNHELKDPLFETILRMVATWANEEGLINRKCTNFLIEPSNKEDELIEITCEVEQDEQTDKESMEWIG